MTHPSEGSRRPPEAADQLDLSGEVPTEKSHRPPLRDEFSGNAKFTPAEVSVSWETRSSDLGAPLTFLFIATIALGAGSVVVLFARLWDAPGSVAVALGTTAGLGVFVSGLRFCRPSMRGKRG